ncbi:MAG: glycosyltransferase family 2 protein [Candidatus Hydrogenedentes bacterium]|nr:glycosyltransferase family 2 protein [Candidatus Hydrogenedentota bacterium]
MKTPEPPGTITHRLAPKAGQAVAAAGVTTATCPLDLSVIIPAFNEAKRIGKTLDQLQTYLGAPRSRWQACEVIVVCDGCEDDTQAAVEQRPPALFDLHVLAYRRNRGKGHALRTGFAESRGDYVLMADADGATPFGELDRLISALEADKADIIIASRRAAGARLAPPQAWYRRALGNLFSLAMRLVMGWSFLDTQCGFKLFRGEAARKLFASCQCDHFGIDVELLYLAQRTGLRVREVGVTWSETGGSRVHVLRDGFRMVRYALWLRFRRTE